MAKLSNWIIYFVIYKKLLEVSLFEPRIPQNTGSIARTCAAYDVPLNLIEPFGFKIDDKHLKRAGLDYWHLMKIRQYKDFYELKESKRNKRIISFSKKNGLYLRNFNFKKDDILLFGREDNGLPVNIIKECDELISIYMPNKASDITGNDGVRSLNLSVACGIALYEAHKQINEIKP
tara:strand:+ start:769 stop:1299 length:531 start_codon:yes stop_codon:yes gene_type:complete